MARAGLDIIELNAIPRRPGWSAWTLSGHHPATRLEGTCYEVRRVRARREGIILWFWGRAGRPGGQRAEDLEAAQVAAEAAAAIDNTLRGL